MQNYPRVADMTSYLTFYNDKDYLFYVCDWVFRLKNNILNCTGAKFLLRNKHWNSKLQPLLPYHNISKLINLMAIFTMTIFGLDRSCNRRYSSILWASVHNLTFFWRIYLNLRRAANPSSQIRSEISKSKLVMTRNFTYYCLDLLFARRIITIYSMSRKPWSIRRPRNFTYFLSGWLLSLDLWLNFSRVNIRSGLL